VNSFAERPNSWAVGKGSTREIAPEGRRRRRPAATHSRKHPAADAACVTKTCDQEGDPVNKTRHPAPSRRLAAAALAFAGLLGAVTAATATAQASPSAHPAATGGAEAPQTIHLVAHEKQRKFINEGGFGDQEIFRGILDNAAGTHRIGIFAGTLTSVSANDSLNLATVDLQLPGGQITVQGFLFGSRSRIVHAVTGGTGIYRGAGGVFSFTSSSPGVLDMTLTLLR
jgi:hypothetical protein